MKINIIDDGFSPQLVETALFAGILEIPILETLNEFIVPTGLIPYSQIKKSKDNSEFVHFYENDFKFKEVIESPEDALSKLKPFSGVISPDCSLYRDMPLVLQLVNIYMSRAIGYYLQKNGVYVIPNVRWGDERSYGTECFEEKAAFLGIPKQSIVSVGTYGCIKSKEDKYYFKSGLEAMLEELEPKIVLVYGAMPDSVFKDYIDITEFHQYPDWISQKKGRVIDGDG